AAQAAAPACVPEPNFPYCTIRRRRLARAAGGKVIPILCPCRQISHILSGAVEKIFPKKICILCADVLQFGESNLPAPPAQQKESVYGVLFFGAVPHL